MYLLTTRNFKRGINVDFYVDEQNPNDFWVTQAQIGKLLGWYNVPERYIQRIHNLFTKQLIFSFKEIEINARYKGIRKAIVYNFDGLIKICTFSNKRDAAKVVNFLWEFRQEFMTSSLAIKSELQLFNYGEKQVRLIKQGNEVWFVAKDVCDILELENPTKAIKSLDDDEKNTLTIREGNQNQRGNPTFNIVNEPGLYKLIFKSRKAEAKQFTRWVTHEVIPAVIRTGTYTIGVKPQEMLTGKATDTKFYSADELAAELGTSENIVMINVCDNNLDMYGFFDTDECVWYFTEEGRAKILEASQNETWI